MAEKRRKRNKTLYDDVIYHYDHIVETKCDGSLDAGALHCPKLCDDTYDIRLGDRGGGGGTRNGNGIKIGHKKPRRNVGKT